MTRVDFYVLQDDAEQQRIDMVCKLAEKAIGQSKTVFIHTVDERITDSIDSALWHFRADSFVPHRILSGTGSTTGDNLGQSASQPEPVEIGCGLQPDSRHSILINLATDVPPFFSRFERTLEVVNQLGSVRASGRVRYSFYQQRGYPLRHHKI